MSYDKYKTELAKYIAKATNEKLDAFCHEIVLRILPFVEKADETSLFDEELIMVNKLKLMIKLPKMNWFEAKTYLGKLTEIAEQHDEHAIEIDEDIIGFLCALDSWSIFANTYDKSSVENVSEAMMNILDSYYIDQVSLEDWLSVPQIMREFELQKDFLKEV